MKVVKGSHNAAKMTFAIVVGEFNAFITEKLLEGALDHIERSGGSCSEVVWVPGAYELPLVAKRLASKKGVDAVIALGCVIRGATPHFDYVCSQAASGIMKASLELDTPISFGVLTTDTIEQAIERAGTKAGNKGAEAAITAVNMVSVLKSI